MAIEAVFFKPTIVLIDFSCVPLVQESKILYGLNFQWFCKNHRHKPTELGTGYFQRDNLSIDSHKLN